ncbi:Ig-like domain-containing protein [Staphylococcus delphini]|uniref:Ig-like domain-containing protein n=1 Tax=Staphylococcus delphini TaxID=53344 RepID=UPI001BAEEEE3|nr:Ig-like domain-containing protein [Staphylococcus delphini]QUM67055.1 YSIRK-type signal peptide-containing protein [Staphylococcus delphini]
MSRRTEHSNKKVDFLTNKLNRYSIRKYTVGTASLLIGATLVFGLSGEAKAAEVGKNTNQEEVNTTTSAPLSSEANDQKAESVTMHTDSQLEEEMEGSIQSESSIGDGNKSEESVKEVTENREGINDKENSLTTSNLDDRGETSQKDLSREKVVQNESIPSDEKNKGSKLKTKDSFEGEESHEIHQNEPSSNLETENSLPENQQVSIEDDFHQNRGSVVKNQVVEEVTEAKEDEVKRLLNDKFSDEEINTILKYAHVDYENDSTEQIDMDILKASLVEFVKKQDSMKVLGALSEAKPRARRALSSRVLVAPKEKSLGYTDNYTFATLIFESKQLTGDLLNGKEIPFEIHSYMSGANSGNRYKIDLKLDPIISKHVTKITVNPAQRKTPIEFTRLTENGESTDIWEVNFIRANGGLFGGAEILSQYTATNGKIELDDTLSNIINNAGDLSNNKLNYQIYVRDSSENRIVRTSESSGYFLTNADNDLVDLENNISKENENNFLASSGTAVYDSTADEHGSIIVDQQIMKKGVFSYTNNKKWSYHYQIDKDLIPYIKSVELHSYDYNGLKGFDKTYTPSNKVVDLQIDNNGVGVITSDRLNNLIVFNNGLPETVGIRVVIKLNQSANNILTKNAEYDEKGNLISETVKQKEDFTFVGYLTDKDNLLINKTLGTSTLTLQDYDKDGLLDSYEREVSMTFDDNEDTDGDGKNDGDEVVRYKTSPLVGIPSVSDITTEDNSVSGFVSLKEGAAEQTAKIINSQKEVVGHSKVNKDGTFTILVSSLPEGTYTIAIDSPNYENDEVSTFKVIDISKLPVPAINPVDDNDTEIVVNGEAGSIVTVKDQDDNMIGTGSIPTDGNMVSIQLDNPLKAGTVLTATISKNGKVSDPSLPVQVTDKTAPEAPTVNEVTSEDKVITGTAEAGSTVTVTFPDGTTATGTADDNGSYTIDMPSNVDLKGGEELKVTSTDKDGNKSEEGTTQVTDKTAPKAPTVNEVTSEDKVITGTAEAGSTVTVTFPDGTTATGTADDNGSYTIDMPSNVDLKGGEELKVTSTDKDGNKSEEATTQVTDKTAPKAPTVNEVTSEDKVITGTAEAGSTVTVTFPDGTTATGTADDNGSYTIDMPSNVDLKGGEELKVTSTDKDGNKSEEGTTQVTDKTAPKAPTVNEVTSEDKVITGTAEAGSTVTVTFPDGTTATGTADDNGSYTIDMPSNVDLKGGEELKVTSTDKDGNKSEEGTTQVTDKTAPKAPTVNEVTSEDKVITGTAEAGSTVTVTFPDGTTATGTADDNGSYTIDMPSNVDLKGGEELKVTSTDKDGNKSEEGTTQVTDKTAPKAPTVNEVTSEDKVITGTAEAGSTVTVTFPDGTTATGTADDNGSYTIDMPSNVDLKGGEELKVTSTDKDGNKSEEGTTQVTDKTAPKAPTVNEVTSEDKVITGTAEAGSTVTVTFPDGTTATGTADDNGSYTIDMPSNVDLKGGEELKVTSTDKDGNKSEEGTTQVTDKTAPKAPTVNEVTSEDKVITGTAEAGSTVTVTFPDGTTATGTADDNGSYTIDMPSNVDLKGGEELKVTSTDKDGNKSEEGTTQVTDKTAPKAPTVNEVTSEDKVITGTAEAGSTVTVTFPDGTTATGTADDNGSYTIDMPSNVDLKGGEELKVTSTDKDGNKSEEGTTQVTDKTAPKAPTVNEVTSEDKVITGTADDNGSYTIDMPSNVDLKGGEELKVTSTDKDGNKSEEGTTQVTDKTAPKAPTVNEVTSEDKVITGTAEAGSTVTVTFPDGTTATGTADDNGSYTIDMPSNVDLKGGEELKVTSTDKDGNKSEEGTTQVTDKTAPKAPTVNEVTSEDKVITGTAEAGSTVTVTFPDGTTATGTADDNGSYTIDMPSNVDLKGGEELKVTSTDKDGNKSEEGTTQNHLPVTGENSGGNGTLFGTLFATVGTLLLFMRRRKNREDE